MRLLVDREFATLPTEEIEAISEIDLFPTEDISDAPLIPQEAVDRYKKQLEDMGGAWFDFNNNRKEDTELTEEQIADLVAASFQTIADLSNTLSQVIQNNYQNELNALDRSLEDGQISRERYEERKRQLQRKAAQSERDARLFSAILNTAAAVTSALNTQPFLPLGPIMAGIAAASGAAQIAAIASTPIPSFADGGFINDNGEFVGRKHSQGGIHIEAEGGEFITAAKYAQPNKDILKAINSGSWEKYKVDNIIAPAIEQVLEGGLQGLGASYSLQNNFNDKNLLKGTDRLRQSNKDGFIYLGDRLERALSNKKRGGYRA